MSRIGFIGGGNMAEALMKGMIAAKVYLPKDIFVSDIRAERLEYLKKQYIIVTETDNASLAQLVSRSMDILILSVKPQNMTEALESIKDAVKAGALVISIAAGIKVSKITSFRQRSGQNLLAQAVCNAKLTPKIIWLFCTGQAVETSWQNRSCKRNGGCSRSGLEKRTSRYFFHGNSSSSRLA